MPKDWDAYRSEVQQLYIGEGRTVTQVREILKARHGFDASVRAYRTKFDEWGLRKYRLRNGRLPHPGRTVHPSPPEPISDSSPSTISHPSPFNSSSPEDGQLGMSQSSTPPLVYPVPVLLELINAGMYSSISVLETLLLHWQPGLDYIEVLLSYFRDPDFNKWVARYPGPATPAVFKLIEDYVPEEEQFHLTKALLEADLTCVHESNHYYTPWQESWHQVCKADEWDEAKELLYKDGVLSIEAGLFLECALVVMAEFFLTRLSLRLERPPDPAGHDAEARRECKEQYREILNDFRHSKADVSPYFYKFLLRIDFDENSDSAHDSSRWAEYRQKYLQLKTPLLLSAPSVTLPPQEPAASKINSRKAAHILLKKWRLLTGFEEYAQSVLMRDGSGILVLQPLQPGRENLFDVVVEILSGDDLESFAKSLLLAFTTALDRCAHPSWVLRWWCSISLAASWEKFQATLTSQELAEQLARCMSPAAARTFTNAAICLIGEKLLESLKNGMVLARRRESGAATPSVEAFADQSRRQQRYMAILGEFQKRNMKVDQSWISYLLNVM